MLNDTLLVDDDFLEELGYLFGTKTPDETLDLVNSFDFNPPQSFGVVTRRPQPSAPERGVALANNQLQQSLDE